MTDVYQGQLSKMEVVYENPIQYRLKLGEMTCCLNEHLGETIHFEFLNKMTCIACHRLIKKTFNQGYCYPCLQRLAACDTCQIKPELCHFEQGTCREPAWGEMHCFKPHIIYLSHTSTVKVGITREKNVPTRWIDQGATQALSLCRVQTRQQSGLVEVALKTLFEDKTNWRAMLKGAGERIDFTSYREEAFGLIENLAFKDEIEFLQEPAIEINYPVISYPTKIASINLDKTPTFEAILLGMKAQYLITSIGVINLRKDTGYEVKVSFSAKC